MNKILSKIIFFSILGAVFLFPEIALAGNGNTQTTNFQEFVTNGVFKTIIDMGLLFLAAFQWFLYWNGWSPQGAFKDILVPAVITFMAFNWIEVLGWIGLLG